MKDVKTTQLTLVDVDGADMKWDYDATKKTLTQTKSGVNKVLLTECDSLQFSFYQRNPVGGSYDQYPVAAKDTTKVIQIQWTCSRQILGKKSHTESVRSAKIVLRKV